MATTEVAELFDTRFLHRLESLSLLARQLVRGRQRAERRSVLRGSSVEFAEYRPFAAGDDWRYIDWNAFARWRQLVLKLFVEEEDLHVHLLLDCSGSMDWGSPVKYDHARRVVAGLAYITLANLDRAAVVSLGHDESMRWSPSRGRHRFLQLLRFLAKCPVVGNSFRLEDAARRWVGAQPRRGVALWVGDLWGMDGEDALKAIDRIRYARHEVAVIQLMDPAEGHAGDIGEFEFQDCESGEKRMVIVDSRATREYRKRFEDYQQSILTYCRRHQIPLLQVDTQVDVDDLLMKSLMHGGFVR